MRLYTYILTLCHDSGTKKIEVVTRNKQMAKSLVCDFEGCPKSAIIKIIRK